MLKSLFISSAFAAAFATGAMAQSVGTQFCTPSNNSAGTSALLTGVAGTGVGSDLRLQVAQGVPGEVGYFLAGNEATGGVALHNGMFCLVGTGTAQVYRYNVAGSPFNSIGRFDASGELENLMGTSTTGIGFDVPAAIPSHVPITIMDGDTWHFQFWHRDSGGSNFSNGLSVTFPVIPAAIPIPGMVHISAGTFEMGSSAASTARVGPPMGIPCWWTPGAGWWIV
ncbi:MAG: hypothetical protein P1V35_06950 [Planctomycetota bacterium]|nr:hypothetical protein [Planctomycetota bacterium]